MPRRTSTLSRTHKRETQAEYDARRAFNAAVWAKGPCIRYPHCRCSETSTVDAHHCIRAQVLRRETSQLPEALALAIIYSEANGIPVCRWLHDNLSVAAIRLTLTEIESKYPEVIEFADEHGWTHLLERELAKE